VLDLSSTKAVDGSKWPVKQEREDADGKSQLGLTLVWDGKFDQYVGLVATNEFVNYKDEDRLSSKEFLLEFN
jgi:hypothetical protein